MYLKTSALDCTDLLDQLRVFLEGAGWATDYYAPRSGLPNSGVQFSFHKDDLYATMLSNVSEVANPTNTSDKKGRVYVQVHGVFALTQTPELQAGSSGQQMTNGLTDPIKTVYFFEGMEDSSPYVHVVCEVTTGVFKHFSVGKMKKRGQAYNGGQFCTASNWYYNSEQWTDQPDDQRHTVAFDDATSTAASYSGMCLRLDLDGVSPRWWKTNISTTDANALRVGFRGANQYGTIHALKDWALSTETGRTPLIPLHTAIYRAGFYSYVGEPPGVRYIDITNYEGAHELAVGSDTWMVFPVHRKIFTDSAPYSGQYGYAYKKVID